MYGFRKIIAAVVATATALVFIAPAGASHSWGGYHWARESSPFTLGLGDNLSGKWGPHLDEVSVQWSASTVLDTQVFDGSVSPRRCNAQAGVVNVCNAKYGSNGWLGVAQIWLSGGHIAAGTVKLNDTYYDTSTYDTPGWRRMVMCQEVGHTFGLGHQDEAFSNDNLGSCMDYTNDPDRDDGAGDNRGPNAHDFALLEDLYGHLDATTTVGPIPTADSGSGGKGNGNGKGKKARPAASSEWGHATAYDASGSPVVFERDLGDGQRVITHVYWVGAHDH